MNNGLPMGNYVDVFLAVLGVHLAVSFLTPQYLLTAYSMLMIGRVLIAYRFEL